MSIEPSERPIERVMNNAFARMKGLIGADTVVGNPVTTADGTSIVPISRVTMGFLTGGGEYSDLSRERDEFPFAGGSGAGVSVSPVCFLVSDGKSVRLVPVDEKNAYDKLVDSVTSLVEAIVSKKKGDE